MKKTIRIGSRDSTLAVTQAEIVKASIQRAHPEISIELITMKTTGDMILDRNLDQIGGKGLFVKELDQALHQDKIDISVHSLKDMPMEISKDMPILVYTKREDPRDILLYKPGQKRLPHNAIIGTSSKRRALQLQQIFPACTFPGIRGNVHTRLGKLETEDYDGIVLAVAGLKRLNMQINRGRIFSVTEVIPAAGQGILAVQGRTGDDTTYLDCLKHRESTIAALAERRFIQILDGGCSSPIAAYAEVKGTEIQMTGLYYNAALSESAVETMAGEARHCEQLGEKLALKLRSRLS